MKASKFTEAQKAFILKYGEQGTPLAEICRKAGISQATYDNWKKKYGGLLPDEMRRLKALEDENTRLKKIVADLTRSKGMKFLLRPSLKSSLFPTTQGIVVRAWLGELLTLPTPNEWWFSDNSDGRRCSSV